MKGFLLRLPTALIALPILMLLGAFTWIPMSIASAIIWMIRGRGLNYKQVFWAFVLIDQLICKLSK